MFNLKYIAIAVIFVTLVGGITAILTYASQKSSLEAQVKQLQEEISKRDQIIEKRRKLDETIRDLPVDDDDLLGLLCETLGIDCPN